MVMDGVELLRTLSILHTPYFTLAMKFVTILTQVHGLVMWVDKRAAGGWGDDGRLESGDFMWSERAAFSHYRF